jgi:hypothetical protein
MPVCDDDITRSFFRASIRITVGNGASTLFWKGRWLNGQGVDELALDLLGMVPARRRGSITVRAALENHAWIRDINNDPLTLPVLIQYMQLRELVDVVHLTKQEDSVAWKWCPLGSFSSCSAYVAMFIGQSGMVGAPSYGRLRRLWNTSSFSG